MGDTEGEDEESESTSGPQGLRAPARSLAARMAFARLGTASAADFLADCNTPRQTAKLLRDKYGVSRNTANRYVASALRQLVADASNEPIESKRARMVHKLDKVAKAAMEAPDYRAAIAALALLAQVEGLTKLSPG